MFVKGNHHMKNRIRALRAEKNITQLRLSMELEVAQETISAYEKGKYSPSLNTLVKLADLFDVSIDYLIGRSDVRKPESAALLQDEEALLISRYRSLNSLDRARLMAYSQGIAEATGKSASQKSPSK